MGVDLSKLNDQQKGLIDSSDAKAIGLKSLPDNRAKIIAKNERELQNQIAAWLRLNGLYFDCDSMAKKRTGTLGAPDIQFPYKGKFIAWEIKYLGALRPDQAKVRDQIIEQGGEWRLIRSFEEARQHLVEINDKAHP